MPNNKNQHFVPRCLLRPFTLAGAGTAINVFNIARDRPIWNASVKSQCSRDYFYGHDRKIESILASLEGEFAATLKKLQQGDMPNDDEKRQLLLFSLVQWRRTAATIEEMKLQQEDFKDKVLAGHQEQRHELDLTHNEIVVMSMRMGVDMLKYTLDLKVSIFLNRSSTDFVISDNPSVLTNRLHLQRWNNRNFGVSNSGAIFSLPLSPKLSFIAYDRAAYTIANSSGFVEVRKDADVSALNELQVLSATENLYFSQPSASDKIGELLRASKSERQMPTFRNTMLILDSEDQDVQTFRVAESDELETANLTHTELLSRKPQRWPSQLTFRSKIKTFGNGSSVGHVRKEDWLSPSSPIRPFRFKEPTA
ncbi:MULTISPECIES: DUF4238 domain-containing protein [unclassified Bradyrhizobium]|uniref:DUF4238 domain-containing protein n=1 Tax=unclassified Bradyrhizobium TaxID=2631580 RepID=UPI00143DEF40|nr:MULTISPECIES: DUF4238 domain-containing protein [unclassified Bradyrhizobium]